VNLANMVWPRTPKQKKKQSALNHAKHSEPFTRIRNHTHPTPTPTTARKGVQRIKREVSREKEAQALLAQPRAPHTKRACGCTKKKHGAALAISTPPTLPPPPSASHKRRGFVCAPCGCVALFIVLTLFAFGFSALAATALGARSERGHLPRVQEHARKPRNDGGVRGNDANGRGETREKRSLLRPTAHTRLLFTSSGKFEFPPPRVE
jgi:hypothetical protein